MMHWIKSVWRECVALVLGISFFYFSGTLIQRIEPTAGVFDFGMIQAVALGAGIFFFGIFCVWLAIRLSFPILDQFFDFSFEKEFQLISTKERLWIAIITFLAMLFIFAQCCKLGS